MVGLIGSLNLSKQILLLLGGGLVLEGVEDLARLAGLASAGPLVLLCERIVLGLALAHGLLDVRHLLLGGETVGLPRLAVALAVHGELDEIVVHLLEGGGEVGAIFSHALVDPDHLVVGVKEGAGAVVGSSHDILSSAADLLEALGLVFLKLGSLLEEE